MWLAPSTTNQIARYAGYNFHTFKKENYMKANLSLITDELIDAAINNEDYGLAHYALMEVAGIYWDGLIENAFARNFEDNWPIATTDQRRVMVAQWIDVERMYASVEAKGTEGPWSAFDMPDERGEPPMVAILQGVAEDGTRSLNGGDDLAQAFGPDRIDNARVMAAAPDLLKALKLMVRYMPENVIDGSNEEREKELKLVSIIASAAIAKAEITEIE
jgi:hypothetical protein